jgi:hypothetical protein
MTWKRSVAAACLVAGLSARLVGAQEPTPPPAPTPEPTPAPAPAPTAAAAAPPIEAKPKEAFFGNRFALYLEVRAGNSTSDELFTDIKMTQNLETQTTTQYESIKHGEFTIGWTLPRDRGQYLFTYTGVADGGYSLDAVGLQRAYVDPSGGPPHTLESLLPWWHTTISDGHLRSVQKPATWDSVTDDADGDGFPDASEIHFPSTTVDVSRSVPDDLGAHLSTYDLYYRREFGGTRYHARWTAGGRYLDFGAALPMPLWINVGAGTPGVGYTEGIVNPLLVTQHKATGWGPVGSGEIQFNFFRRRLQLYGLVRAAYVVQRSEVDSGVFQFLARDTGGGGTVPRQGHFDTSTNKSTWNTTFETGVRFRILPGFHVFADWNKSGYLDPIIVPTEISLPTNSGQVDQPVGVSYKTEDLVLSTIQVGLSFQF